MSSRLTLVLPVDAAAPATRRLAAGIDGFGGRRFGIVDNGLWRSMDIIRESFERTVCADGAAGVLSTPFDHLAIDFAEQQAALGPFADKIDAAVTGLGN